MSKTTAPMPTNFRAMSDAWDNPIAFAKEVHQYYQQLGTNEPHWTEKTT